MTDTFPVLYILMRTDLPSMNAGKAMAQASHASNAFWKGMNDSFLDTEGQPNTVLQDLANEWQLATTQGFGTVLVLAVTDAQMRSAVDVADYVGFDNGLVTDPTYPYQTTAEMAALVDESKHTLPPVVEAGRATLFREEVTCGWIFGDKNDMALETIVGAFNLHP